MKVESVKYLRRELCFAGTDRARKMADKAENNLVKMTVENERLKDEQKAALRKEQEEIKKMYEDGLSLESISRYKNKDIPEIKKILGID